MSDPTPGSVPLPTGEASTSTATPPVQQSTGDDLAADIRKQVETEQALKDAQQKLKELEVELERVKAEKQSLESTNTESGQSDGVFVERPY